MSIIQRNIKSIQKSVNKSITYFLISKGYTLVAEEQSDMNLTCLLQWINTDKNHSIQLNWDLKERWFELGEFNRSNNLIFTEATPIEVFPFMVIGRLLRKRYNKKYTDSIVQFIEKKLSPTPC